MPDLVKVCQLGNTDMWCYFFAFIDMKYFKILLCSIFLPNVSVGYRWSQDDIIITNSKNVWMHVCTNISFNHINFLGMIGGSV